ncbi:HTH domain-containing protein [Candidatus Nomurabacteria bacterium]|nr:HTH domain-containing protein [Candidatus Nomurabacteria bacterium]MCB9826665.1 HTH domain-containing protein [Candidatus Nomurabacteria bacterium]
MGLKSADKTAVILQWILDGYSLAGYRIDKLEFSACAMAKNADVDISMLPMILDNLENKRLIKTYGESGEDYGIQELTYTIFFFDNFKLDAKAYLDEEKRNISASQSGNSTILYIDSNGNFWHGDKNKFCYEMGAKSNRFLTVKFLNDNEGFQPTRELAEKLDVPNAQNVRTEIKKIRNNITKYLKIDGERIIESKKGSGYRINPGYKILEQDS